MFKLDLNRLEGIFGVGCLGGNVACFLVFMASNLVSKEGIMDTAQYIGLYSMIAGVICLAVGSGLLVLNFFISRSKEIEGVPTWQMLIFFCVVGVTDIVTTVIVALTPL